MIIANILALPFAPTNCVNCTATFAVKCSSMLKRAVVAYVQSINELLFFQSRHVVYDSAETMLIICNFNVLQLRQRK